jgi:hypothetical protein
MCRDLVVYKVMLNLKVRFDSDDRKPGRTVGFAADRFLSLTLKVAF